MNTTAAPRGGFVILTTLVIALALMFLPLPEMLTRLRPDVLLLVLVYWVMALPHRIGIFTGFIAGLLMDGATSSLVGQHALVYVISLWIVMLYHKRLRVTTRWKQTLLVIGLLFFEKVVAAIVLGATRSTIPDGIFWLPPLMAILVWPWLFPFLRNLRRRFYIY